MYILAGRTALGTPQLNDGNTSATVFSIKARYGSMLHGQSETIDMEAAAGYPVFLVRSHTLEIIQG